jgi:cytochrome c oxidase assembly protein subunit 15
MPAFTRFAWSVLTVNLGVVAWGAFVRATGSGAGCGRHWPTCNGEIVPRAPAVATAIEFGHRASSGIALLLVVALAGWAVRAFPRGHAARKAAWAALALMVTEALVGASLVLFGWVAKDASAARGWVMAIHLTNTFLLLGALALAAEWSARPAGVAIAGRTGTAAALAAGLAMVLLAGVTGAVAALGDTLYPATGFAAGLRHELSDEAHLLLRLRLLHPLAAISAGAVLLAVARSALRARPDDRVRRAALAIAALVAIEIAAGAVNVLLLAPVWLQLVHLLVADSLWIALVLLSAATLAPDEASARSPLPLPRHQPGERVGVRG